MIESFLKSLKSKFTVSVELVPPAGEFFEKFLSKLEILKFLPIDGFSVATNPLGKPVMDALVTSFLVQEHFKKPALLHCVTRDQNRLALQSRLWGAKVLGIKTILAMTGDLFLSRKDNLVSTVCDIDVSTLVETARETGLETGVVLGQIDCNQKVLEQFQKKILKGAEFLVTQPVYSLKDVEIIKSISHNTDIPIVMGIMPLQSVRHVDFLNKKVKGISIPDEIFERMFSSKNQMEEGINIAAEMLCLARKHFNGACVMPPFNRFETIYKIFKRAKAKMTI